MCNNNTKRSELLFPDAIDPRGLSLVPAFNSFTTARAAYLNLFPQSLISSNSSLHLSTGSLSLLEEFFTRWKMIMNRRELFSEWQK